MLFLDGVYVKRADGSMRFRWVKAPPSVELSQLTHRIAQRVGRFLERQGPWHTHISGVPSRSAAYAACREHSQRTQ